MSEQLNPTPFPDSTTDSIDIPLPLPLFVPIQMGPELIQPNIRELPVRAFLFPTSTSKPDATILKAA